MADSAVRRAIDGGMRMRMAFQDGELKLISLMAEEAGKIIELPGPMEAYDSGSLSRRMRDMADALYEDAMRIARQTLADAYESVAQEIESFADEMQRMDDEASAALDMDLKAAEDWARQTVEDISGTSEYAAYAEAQETIARVESDIDTAIRIGINHMQRDADDVYRKIINDARDTAQADWSALRTSAKRTLNEFAEQGVTGFTDRLGRRWGLPEYVDMALRTGAQRASLGATISGMMAHGMDLCYVNAHMGCCEKCLKWQGVIMSLRGAPGYPSLADAIADGLFHPNCAHILQLFIEGYSRPGIGAPDGYTEEENAELYAKRQQQRYMERQLRKWKRLQAAALTPEDERIAQAHVKLWQRRIRELIGDDQNMPRRYDREGGRVVLSDAAKKLKPLQIGKNGGEKTAEIPRV